MTLHLPLTNLDESRSPETGRKKPSGAEQRANHFPPQSWCKQPCCRELVPVSGLDRAHRLHSGAAPRLSLSLSPCRPDTNPPKTKSAVYRGWIVQLDDSPLQSAGHGNISARRTDGTSWYIATLQCSSGERPYSNHAAQGRAPVISVDFESCGLLRGRRWRISYLASRASKQTPNWLSCVC